MKASLLILLVLAAAATATWIGDEYWTTIDAGGQPFHGSVNDFARIDGYDNKFIAFWITRTYYPGEHFEAFGEAYLNAGGRVCGTFVGFRRENIEICGQFRVLSVPARYAGKHIFDWVDSHTSMLETVGYLAHRIAKVTNDREIIYGDAIPSRRTFAGALPSRSDSEIIESDSDFLQRVQLLRLNVPEEISRRPTVPRLPPPPPPVQMQVKELICDQFGNAFEKHQDREGRTIYLPYDERANGGRRPNCPYYAPVIQHPVPLPPRNDRYAHAILPDHHDADGKTIDDSVIGYARRYRRKVLNKMRRSGDDNE